MNTYAGKIEKNGIQSVSNEVAQRQDSESTFEIVDNRPAAIAQRKLQATADNGPHVSQFRAIQDAVNNHAAQQPKLVHGKESKADYAPLFQLASRGDGTYYFPTVERYREKEKGYYNNVDKESFSFRVQDNNVLYAKQKELKGSGRIQYVFTPSRQLYGDYYGPGRNEDRKKGEFHTRYLGGGDIVCGGWIHVNGNAVVKIANNSGHYKPGARGLYAFCEYLLQNGTSSAVAVEFVGNGAKPGNYTISSFMKHYDELDKSLYPEDTELDSLQETNYSAVALYPEKDLPFIQGDNTIKNLNKTFVINGVKNHVFLIPAVYERNKKFVETMRAKEIPAFAKQKVYVRFDIGESQEPGFELSITDDTYKAIAELAEDRGLEVEAEKLVSAFKKGQPYVSKKQMESTLLSVAPDESRVIESIVEYIIEEYRV